MNGNFRKIFKKILLSIFHQRLINYLYFIYGCTVNKKSFSQFSEDLLVSNYFKYKGIKNGKYLDIGSFHPIWISNTHLLHKEGFTGYAVDLSEEKLKFFRLLRGKKVKTICGAVSSNHQDSINYYKFKKGHCFSEIDTISKDIAVNYEEQFGLKYDIIKVKNYHINDIFKIVGKVNFLNIDIEGLDVEVLLNCNIKISNPEVIIFEDNSKFFEIDLKLKEFLKQNNYYNLFTTGYSKGFAKK